MPEVIYSFALSCTSCVCCTAHSTRNASVQILFKCPAPAIVFGNGSKHLKTLTFCSLLTRCRIPCACQAKRHLNVQKWSEHLVLPTTTTCTFFDMSTSIQLPEVARSWCALRILTWKCASGHNACTFSTSQLPKMVRSWWVLYVLTLKCASRHNGVHFFDMSTSIQLPEVARSWCALRILTWKCASGHNACTFSTSQLPKMVRSWWVLYVLTLKCASRHNGVHFFDISAFKSVPRLTCFDFEMCFAPQWRAIVHLSSGLRWLRIRRFSEPTFQPSLATNHWKSTVFHAFSTFSRACIPASSFF